jgi:hypothetical protein
VLLSKLCIVTACIGEKINTEKALFLSNKKSTRVLFSFQNIEKFAENFDLT